MKPRKHLPFDKKNQPVGRGRPKRRQIVPEKEGKYSRREVLRAAEQGVEAEDLALTLGLIGRLQTDTEFRKEFEETVALGHGRFKTAAAKRIYDEGVGKGKPSALLEIAKRWIGRYGDDVLTGEEIQGTVQRALEFVKQFKQRESENAS